MFERLCQDNALQSVRFDNLRLRQRRDDIFLVQKYIIRAYGMFVPLCIIHNL